MIIQDLVCEGKYLDFYLGFNREPMKSEVHMGEIYSLLLVPDCTLDAAFWNKRNSFQEAFRTP